ncbi:hypothetical protein MSAR_28000 [Mycolicibacterium sarraceniae]|uniref:Oxidoreductase n=2 Tax=Mycolicibacterium sarraceniae TaxID=1534348 RepID=A0A7I7SRP0_9MYCO|nr:hypothetical protein MSAR_28000 [Mycolicibacterium sarraceniae]
MPAGMMLKSQPFASSLSAPGGQGSLAAYCATKGIPYHDIDIPVSLELFTEYALDFQEGFVEVVEPRQVVALDRTNDGYLLELDDGEVLPADLVVCAIGISYFDQIPEELQHLPSQLVSHTAAHSDLSDFADRRVAVVGGGSSAVDFATLAHEAGAHVSVVARRPVKFTPTPPPGPRPWWQRICYPSSGLGPSIPLWLYEKVPNLFRHLPGGVRLRLIRRVLGPQTPSTMKARFEAGVGVTVVDRIEQAHPERGKVRLVLAMRDGRRREMTVDHVIAAAGYYPRVSSVDFLSEELRSSIRTHAEMPVLSAKFESSVPGLYFVGLPAVNSFGPLMRFVVGAQYVAPRVAHEVARRVRALEPTESRNRTADPVR